MQDLTIKKYLEIIESLTIGDLIIYYFYVYFFIILIQKILEVDLDTDGKIKTHPKVLITLVLVQIFQFILSLNRSSDLSIDTLLGGAFFLLLVVLLIELLLFSKFSIIRFFYGVSIHNFALKELREKGKTLDLNISSYEDSMNDPIGISKIRRQTIEHRISALKEDGFKHVNTNAINNQAIVKAKDNRSNAILFFTDTYICIILTSYSYQQNIILGTLTLIGSLCFLYANAIMFIRYPLVSEGNNSLERYLAK